MESTKPISQLLIHLWSHISLRRRGQLVFLLVLIIFASVAEILSVGAVVPFLAVLMTPERIYNHTVVQPFIQAFNLTAPEQLVLPLTVAFGALSLAAGALRLFLLWTSNRLTFLVGADLSTEIFRRVLYQPYAFHCTYNSSHVIDVVMRKADLVIYNVISPVLTIISSGFMILVFVVLTWIVAPVLLIETFGGFFLIYLLIYKLTRKSILSNSKRWAQSSTKVIKTVQEGLGAIRDVLIDGSQNIYSEKYNQANIQFRFAQGNNLFLSSGPRYAIEALGIVAIAAVCYSLSNEVGGLVDIIPSLGMLALSVQRLLPALQQVYGGWTTIEGAYTSLQEVTELLDLPLQNFANQTVSHPIPFRHTIKLNRISFKYNLAAPYVLNQINLSIAKGSRVGFVGTTGSGKSTLLDIVMALLTPTTGTLEVDEKVVTSLNQRAWQAHIAHVPQVIYLSDSTIEENIAFGVPKDQIDSLRVKEAAQQAQLAETIESWPKQYETFVGERGIRLSGGQRQRIGIARALYKQADVIVFDEATSSLDNQTEQAVMQAIEGLSKDLTLLIIAHRITTLKNCSQIIELNKGEIKRIGSYQDMVFKAVEYNLGTPK